MTPPLKAVTTPLDDVQGYADTRGVALKQAGVKQVDMPLSLMEKSGGIQSIKARVSLGVHLEKESKGTHMSRFIIQLTEWSRDKVITLNFKDLLEETMTRLDSKAAHMKMDFAYFIDKKAPVTHYSAPMAFPCSFQASLIRTSEKKLSHQLVLGVTVPVATLCPCSKEISDYGAHNQRAEIRAHLVLDTTTDHQMVWIEDVVAALEECASCPVYPVLKRLDEKYVTERQYDNPKFVEDVVRDATLVLREYPGVLGFSIEVEALESIHGHNAYAFHEENVTATHGLHS